MQITVYENGKIAVEKSAYPVLKSGEARIKIKACGICGSDVPRVFAGKSYYYPIVLGHEFSGVFCGDIALGIQNLRNALQE